MEVTSAPDYLDAMSGSVNFDSTALLKRRAELLLAQDPRPLALDVAQVNPDLVVRDDKGQIYTVRYDAVNAMLLNEFLKEHRKVEDLSMSDAQQKKEIAEQEKQIEAAYRRSESAGSTNPESSAQVGLNQSASQVAAADK